MYLLGLLFIVRHDSVKFLITSGKLKEARLAVCQVYKYANKNVDAYIEKMKLSYGKNSSNLTIMDALVNP